MAGSYLYKAGLRTYGLNIMGVLLAILWFSIKTAATLFIIALTASIIAHTLNGLLKLCGKVLPTPTKVTRHARKNR